MTRLSQLQDQQVLDLSHDLDIDMSDLQDHKFKVGEMVDWYQKKHDRVNHFQVEIVLDEMINCRQVTLTGTPYEGNQQCVMWLACDTDKILPGGEHRKMHRTKVLDQITNQLEA